MNPQHGEARHCPQLARNPVSEPNLLTGVQLPAVGSFAVFWYASAPFRAPVPWPPALVTVLACRIFNMTVNLSFESGAVLVAGGSGGIGEVIARSFAAVGLPVSITYHRNRERALQIQQDIESRGGRCDGQQVDLAQADAVDAWFSGAQAQHGRIGQVIYAAGPHFDFNFIGNIPNDQWHHVVSADINGAFHVLQNAVRVFRKQGGGNLLAVITSAVERVPVADIMSAAPKAAIEMLIRGVAKESGRFGIRANCIGPGWVNAGLGKKGLDEKFDAESREALRKKTIPLQRFGEAADIANAALFLCSQQASYITGQTLAVDGGLQL